MLISLAICDLLARLINITYLIVFFFLSKFFLSHTFFCISCLSHSGHKRRKVLGDCQTTEALSLVIIIIKKCIQSFAGDWDDITTYCSHSYRLEWTLFSSSLVSHSFFNLSFRCFVLIYALFVVMWSAREYGHSRAVKH